MPLSEEQKIENEQHYTEQLNSISEGGVYLWVRRVERLVKSGQKFKCSQKALDRLKHLVREDFFEAHFELNKKCWDNEDEQKVVANKKYDGLKHRMFYIDMKNHILLSSNDKLIQVKLKLAGDNKKRFIGTVTKSTRTIEMKRSYAKGHFFFNINGFGFNDYILREQSSIDWVRLSDDRGNHWKIPVSYILTSDQSAYLHFQKQGYELQRFLSLENLEQFLVLAQENRRLDF